MSGLISASFYSLVPAWMQDEGIARETIAIFMLVAVLGGLAFQVPIGRLSDRFDRRIVLSMLSFGFAVTAIAVVSGFMSTMYPVCVANAHDQMPADQVVAVTGRLILVSGDGPKNPLPSDSRLAHAPARTSADTRGLKNVPYSL